MLCSVKQVMEGLDDQESYVPTLLSYLEVILDKGQHYVKARMLRLQNACDDKTRQLDRIDDEARRSHEFIELASNEIEFT